jgi:pimeloyl-ACP methyl ester carboxylesterase
MAWWDALPIDFWKRREPFELGGFDRLKVGVTSASDVVLRTAGASLVGATALPIGFHPREVARAFGDLDLYASIAEQQRREAFFLPPPRVHIEAAPAVAPLFRPDDGSTEDLRFISPFVPISPRQRERWDAHPRNRIAHARMWRHRGGKPRPTVVAIHGFSADLYHLNEWFFSIPWLYAAGYDVLLVTLPFHGSRQARSSPYSGFGFFSGGPSAINEAFAQGVMDVRIWVNHLLDELGAPEVGVTGVSLGGFTTALLASVEPRLAFAVPNVPVISIADLVMEWEPIGTVVRGGLALAGRTLKDARRLLAPSCPLTWAPLLPKERLFIIGGVGDRLAPPSHSRLLWDHWGRSKLHWFPGSHLVHLDRGQYFRQLRLFFAEIGFAFR